MRGLKKIKCLICKKAYVNLESLHAHIEAVHGHNIPRGMTGAQYHYFLRTGKDEGKCVICGKPTKWNGLTNKYHRLCDNPKCKEAIRKEYAKNMIAKYGKTTLLNDPAHQRKLLASREISGHYKFPNGDVLSYVGSYEKNFLEFLDKFFNWDPNDILTPSPFTYTYEYNGDNLFYIPDMYIISLDVNIEIKDGGLNPNKHPKIQSVDKVKEFNKEKVMLTQKRTSYVKIYDNNFDNFIEFLNKKKEMFINGEDFNKAVYVIEDKGRQRLTVEASGIPTVDIISRYMKVYNSTYNYNFNRIKDFLMKELKNVSSLEDIKALYTITDKILNNKANKDRDIGYKEFDSDKTIEFINNEYLPLLEYKKNNLMKRNRIKFKPIKEGVYNMNDMLGKDVFIYDKDNVNEITPETCPHGFYFRTESGKVLFNNITWIEGKAYRNKVEGFVFDTNNKVFILLHNNEKTTDKDNSYRLPGGGTEPDVEDATQFMYEVNEEALIKVKDILGPHLTYMDKGAVYKPQKHAIKYEGKIRHVYTGIYDGKYTDPVDPIDADEYLARYGSFYDVKDVYPILSKEHKEVFDKVKDIYKLEY